MVVPGPFLEMFCQVFYQFIIEMGTNYENVVWFVAHGVLGLQNTNLHKILEAK